MSFVEIFLFSVSFIADILVNATDRCIPAAWCWHNPRHEGCAGTGGCWSSSSSGCCCLKPSGYLLELVAELCASGNAARLTASSKTHQSAEWRIDVNRHFRACCNVLMQIFKRLLLILFFIYMYIHTHSDSWWMTNHNTENIWKLKLC